MLFTVAGKDPSNENEVFLIIAQSYVTLPEQGRIYGQDGGVRLSAEWRAGLEIRPWACEWTIGNVRISQYRNTFLTL